MIWTFPAESVTILSVPCGRFSFVPQGSMKGKAKSIMKLKRNSLTTLLVVSFLLMALSGCGQQAEPDSAQPPLETVTYSNLTDADSRKLLNEALADANVDETRTKLLLDRVDQFNASVKSEWLTGGFESAATTETRYDPYEMQDLWTEKNGSFPGYNCRITAFSLFGEFVTAGVDQPETQGEDSLFMDLETLAADPAVLCGDSTSKFCALFAPVTAADTTEVADQVKALQAGWSERGISFEDSSARLISVVLHDRFSDTDNTLFIGHVGVLLPAEDGSLYFIEKRMCSIRFCTMQYTMKTMYLQSQVLLFRVRQDFVSMRFYLYRKAVLSEFQMVMITWK